jgi:hypothetical protein
MNSRPNDHLDELLTSATEALRTATPHDEPPRELMASTIERLRALQADSHSSILSPGPARLAKRRELMFRIARYSTAIAAAIVIAVFGWQLFVDRSGLAFAGVIESVKKAESVTLTNKQKIGNAPTMELRWYLQGQRMRLELPGVFAYIFDLSQPTYLELNLIEKVAKARLANKEAREAFANPVEQIQRAKPEDAKRADDEQLDGRVVHVYRLNKVDFLGAKGDGEMTVWVEPKTNLPVKILINDPGDEKGGGVYMEFIDFEWNKKLDEQLFRIPEDFTFKGLEEPRKETEPTATKE